MPAELLRLPGCNCLLRRRGQFRNRLQHAVVNPEPHEQVETGVPFMLYKDACNRKSNQRNLGTIRCSNLCTEIVEYTSPEETAVCNLASIALPRFVRDRAPSGRERVRVVGSLDSGSRCALVLWLWRNRVLLLMVHERGPVREHQACKLLWEHL